MSNLAMSREARKQHDSAADILPNAGHWLMTVLMVFLGLSSPCLCYIKAVEADADAN